MNNSFNNSSNHKVDLDEIDLRKILMVLWNGKWMILSITFIIAVITLLYSLSLPNIYKSKALLNPVVTASDTNNAMRGYGGIASLAGINIQTQMDGSNYVKALEKLTSLSFFSEHIMPNIFLPDLMALESWDARSNTIIYNEDIYKEDKKLWVRNSKHSKNNAPSAQESFAVFINNHLTVSEDQDTVFVTISIRHQSPFVAKAWIELIVKELNMFYRVKDKAEAQAAINFLNAQIRETSFTEIKQVVAELIQEKTQQLTLIEASDFYVFDYIDPPAVMERKSDPKRVLILFIGTIFGGIFGIFCVLLREYFFKPNINTYHKNLNCSNKSKRKQCSIYQKQK